MDNLKLYVEQLLDKAVKATDSGDALRFSEAAFIAAKVKHALVELK